MSRKTKNRRTTAVSKQTRSSQTSFLPAHPPKGGTRKHVLVAFLLAFERKLKAMKEKSSEKKPREMKVRAFQQWINCTSKPEGMLVQVRAIVREAEREAKRFWPKADKTRLAALMCEFLYRDLILERLPKKTGPKPKPKPERGFIGQELINNPAVIANASTVEWGLLKYRLGVEAGTYCKELDKIEKEAAKDILWYLNNGDKRSSAGLDDIAERFGNNLEELDRKMVSDRKVAKEMLHRFTRKDMDEKDRQMTSMFKITPDTSIEALARRIGRARERHGKEVYEDLEKKLQKWQKKEHQKTINKKWG